ncbi:MAG: 4Fe-4S binding protein [Treponema sp.]|nr:4Fe-4S binding protein [Treponema sp.]
MILAIILLSLLVLSTILLIFFIYYIFLPSVKSQQAEKEPLISEDEIKYTADEEQIYERNEKKALVLCNCNKEFSIPVERFNKDLSCFIVHSKYGTGTDCKFACIGLGDCVKSCPQQAITVQKHTAVVTSLCIGCGKCVDACPVGIIALVPSDTQKIRLCSNKGSDLSSCSTKNNEEKVAWNEKKGFKIWDFCYRILKHIEK